MDLGSITRSMPKRDPIEERLSVLAQLRDEDDTDVVCRELQQSIEQKRSGLLVSRAAKMVAELAGEHDLTPLVPSLKGAFQRLLVDPVKRDKGCLGKIEICHALVEMEEPASGVYLAGIHCVQREPVWGGSVDVGAALRGWSALGLVRMRHGEAMLRVAPLLADPEHPTRKAAAEALGDSGQMAAEAVLRLKVASGDEEPEVLGACFESLLRLDGPRSCPFVLAYLNDAEPAVVEAAALALGESRLEEAIEPLLACVERSMDEDLQRSIYLALALSRRPAARDALEAVVEEGPIGRARLCLSSLALQRHEGGLRERLRASLDCRPDRGLERIWAQEWT